MEIRAAEKMVLRDPDSVSVAAADFVYCKGNMVLMCEFFTKHVKTFGCYFSAFGYNVLLERVIKMKARQLPPYEELSIEERERLYEHGLPVYLQHDLDAFKDGLENGSTLMDCLWGELYGSINIAQIDDGAITPEHADYLRQKYLWGEDI